MLNIRYSTDTNLVGQSSNIHNIIIIIKSLENIPIDIDSKYFKIKKDTELCFNI